MIRLPNFRTHSELNDLRAKMRADLIDWDGDARGSSTRISRKDLEALETIGLEIDLADVEVLSDHTFSYQGERILLYIMAPSGTSMPKYHVANCSTWDRMKASGRKDRYVASRRIDGTFVLDITADDGTTHRGEYELDVCKNCLDKIAWSGYSFESMRKSDRDRIFRAFSLTTFFEEKKTTLIKEKPRWIPETMPGASYTDDFDEISSAARKAANWKCSRCKRSFTKTFERRFLQVHHRNGVKGDNSQENLSVLCLGCHADEPEHNHMKRLPDYRKFQALYG